MVSRGAMSFVLRDGARTEMRGTIKTSTTVLEKIQRVHSSQNRSPSLLVLPKSVQHHPNAFYTLPDDPIPLGDTPDDVIPLEEIKVEPRKKQQPTLLMQLNP